MKYKYIAFDIDGTLLDTEYAVLHSLQETILTLSQREILLEELVFALGITGADCGQMLYIGDSEYDSLSARNSGTDFALAVWGSKGRQIKADYYLKKPLDLMNVILC